MQRLFVDTSRRHVPLTDAARALARDLSARVAGEVRFDRGSRALYATDASNYRQVPIGVVLPMTAGDVVETVRTCREHGAPLLSRGGGTSLAGQCCNVAVVMDFSKYMHSVLDLDLERRLATVQPGCILDDLRHKAELHGLTFGPDPATHNRCTLGGMLGNNSCGVHAIHSEFYGPGSRTADNVDSMEILTMDGLRMRVGPTSEAELSCLVAEEGRRGEIYRRLVGLRDRYGALIRERYPDIPRRVSGYDLPALLPEQGFNLAQALVGTESTCVTVLEATMRLIPHRGHRVLVLVGFDSVYDAGDVVPLVREFRPVGCEGIDQRLVDYMRRTHLHERHLRHLPDGEGWLFVEFGAQSDPQEAIDRAQEFCARIQREPAVRDTRVIVDKHLQEEVWEVRESGLGATAFVPGDPDTWPGWEDAGVPPDKVGPYLRDFRALLDRHGYQCSLYGHFGQGCIHTRIDFDLSSEDGVEAYRRFTDEAADLVLRYGGSLSGEHGDGQARGELLPKMYGEELMQAMREFKAIWDPEGLMNPGKVVDARPRTADLRLGPERQPWRPRTRMHFEQDHGDYFHAALRCVGVGKCRRMSSGTMCPSYMVTREEKHTTRGRAHLLFEMLQGEEIQDGWQSEEVKESLDLCLACKGCKGDCPVHVDIPTHKAEFLYHYYQHKPRPAAAYAFGLIYQWARLGSLMPRLANLATRAPGLAAVARAVAGVAQEREIPPFAHETFSAGFRRLHGGPGGGPRQGRKVLLWVDTFNEHFHPDVLWAAVEVLEAAGCAVFIPRARLCCGRPLYDYGMLERAEALWRETMRTLADEIAAGTPIVGLEPSCVSAFRDELVNLFPGHDDARRLSEQTFTFAEFLQKELDGYAPPRLEQPAMLHGHCHDKSILGFDCEQELLERVGLDLQVPDSGCCGMAGAFGFEADKYDVAMAVGERVLLPAAREARARDALLIADGFSCREQVKQGAGALPLHTAQVLRMALRSAGA